MQPGRRRADVDHAPALRPEVLEGFPDHQHRAEHVGVELPVELLHGHRLQRHRRVNPGIVHEDVERAECPFGLSEHSSHVSRLRHVGLGRNGPTSGLGNRVDHGFRAGSVGGVIHYDRGPGRCQGLGDPGPDAFGGTGHQGDFVFEFRHDFTSCPVDTAGGRSAPRNSSLSSMRRSQPTWSAG